MRTRLLVAFFVLVAATSMAACKRNKDKVVQSCWTNDKVLLFGSVGATAECKDQFTDNDSCGGVQKKSKDPCPRANLVAGCKTEDEIHWFYNEGFAGSASPQLVRNYCTKGTVVMPDGKPATGTQDPNAIASADAANVMKTDGPKAKAHLATATQLAAKLPAPTGKLDLGALKGSAILAHKEDLADPEHLKSIPYRLKNTGLLGACSRLLNGRKQSGDDMLDVTACAKYALLLVVSVSEYAPPTAAGSSVSGNTKTTFVKKGRIAGDVLAFRTEDGKYLGSYPFAAENAIVNKAPDLLTTDLLEQFPNALYAKTKAVAPALTVSFDLQK